VVAPSQQGLHQIQAQLACEESGCFASWLFGPPGPVLWSAALTPSGPGPLGTIAGSWATSLRLLEAVAVDGHRFHLFDTSSSGGDFNTYALFSVDPADLDATVVVFEPTEGNPPSAGCTAFQGLVFCVYTTDPVPPFNDLYFQTRAPDGGAIGPPPTQLVKGPSHAEGLAIAALGDRLVAGWSEYESGNDNIYAAIIGADAGVLASHVPVSSVSANETDLAMAAGASSVLAAWTVEESPPRILIAEIDGAGGVQLLPLSFSEAQDPALSGHDGGALIAFDRVRDGGTVLEAFWLPWSDLSQATLVFERPLAGSAAPSLAPVEDQKALLLYSDRSTTGERQLRYTYVGLGAAGAPCVDASTCAQGFECLSSVCAAPSGAGAPYRVACGCQASYGPLDLFALCAAAAVRRARPSRPRGQARA
jgi:hypothetical protein